MSGYFLHEPEGVGWEARLLPPMHGAVMRWREDQLFAFTLNADTPCTFVQDDGTQIRPCLPGESFVFNFGSIPAAVQKIIRKEGIEYAFHDRAYDVGWFWVKAFGETVWRATPVSRADADALLYTMSRCTANPRGRFKAGAIWAAVRAFGWACGYTSAPAKLPDPVPVKCEPVDVDDPLPMGV
jgi:hypothetical protein